MTSVLPRLTWAFSILTSVCKWGFISTSLLIIYLDGFTYTVTNWLLLLTIMFALAVTICETFAILRVRLSYLIKPYARQRTKNQHSK